MQHGSCAYSLVVGWLVGWLVVVLFYVSRFYIVCAGNGCPWMAYLGLRRPGDTGTSEKGQEPRGCHDSCLERYSPEKSAKYLVALSQHSRTTSCFPMPTQITVYCQDSLFTTVFIIPSADSSVKIWLPRPSWLVLPVRLQVIPKKKKKKKKGRRGNLTHILSFPIPEESDLSFSFFPEGKVRGTLADDLSILPSAPTSSDAAYYSNCKRSVPRRNFDTSSCSHGPV